MSALAYKRKGNNAIQSLSPYNPINIVYNNPAPSIIGGVIGTQIFKTANAASDIVTDTVKVGSRTAGIVTVVQFGVDGVRFFKGSITGKELGRRVVKNTAVNGTSVVGGTGGAAVGGAVGTGTGTVVGSIIGGVFGSIGIGKLMNDKFDDWWRGYKVRYVNNSLDILNLALEYFGYTPSQFKNSDLITLESLNIKYEEYSKIYHPQYNTGSKEEWIRLVNNYSIVSDAIRKRDRSLPISNKNNSVNKLKRELEEQKTLFIKERNELKKEIEKLQQQLKNIKNNKKNSLLSQDGFDDVEL